MTCVSQSESDRHPRGGLLKTREVFIATLSRYFAPNVTKISKKI